MKLYQHMWQPHQDSFTVRVKHVGSHTEVYLWRMKEPLIVIEGLSLEIRLDDINIPSKPKKVEAARFYENL